MKAKELKAKQKDKQLREMISKTIVKSLEQFKQVGFSNGICS